MIGLAALLLVGTSLANPSPEAAAALASACDGGDAKACGELGARHAGGLGVPVDLVRAGELARKGCDGGDLDSCTHLGVFTLSGVGLEQDQQGAATLFAAACERGALRACHFLGLQHLAGLGLPTNPEEAWVFSSRACEGGVTEACGSLGGMLERGFGVPLDLTKAAEMRDKACEGGDLFSCTRLGALLEDEDGPGVDRLRAGELYLQACRGEEAEGCLRLGDLVATGALSATLGTDPRGMYLRAAELAARSCAAGELLDCWNHADALGKAGQAGAAEQAYRALQPQLDAGCDAGDVRACGFLEDLHRDGRGVPVDPAAADQARARSCELGDATACG